MNNNFDERQLLNRYRIGFESFILTIILIIVNAFIKDSVVEWANQLDNTFMVLFIALTYFCVRAILADAYYSPANAAAMNRIMILISCFSVFSILWIVINLILGKFPILVDGQVNTKFTTVAGTIYMTSMSIAYWYKRREE